jgi:acetyl-CoA carboxylase carboxyltransferase component
VLAAGSDEVPAGGLVTGIGLIYRNLVVIVASLTTVPVLLCSL